MSETGRKMDVEDVLSSIRRLVSEEARSGGTPEKGSENVEQAPGDIVPKQRTQRPEKLILTPSLRVAEGINSGLTDEIERRITDIETLVNSNKDTAKPGAADAPFTKVPEDRPEMRTAGEEAIAALRLSRDIMQRPEPPLTARSIIPSNDLPATEDAISEVTLPDADTRPEEGTEDAQAEEPQDSPDDAADDRPDAEVIAFENRSKAEEMVADIESNAPFRFVVDTPTEDDIDAEDDPDDSDAFADSPEEAVDVAPARTAGNAMRALWQEKPAQEKTDAAADAISRSVEQEVMDSLQEEITASVAGPETDADDGEEDATEDDHDGEPIDFAAPGDATYIDEETLREMVSDMVRSELQGELGDRITRNVRKLVRREIHRALASREFE